MLTGFVAMIVAGTAATMPANAFQATFLILLLKGAVYLIVYLGLAFAFRFMPRTGALYMFNNEPYFKSDD